MLAQKNSGDRQTLEKRFNSSRHNILLVIVFTLINIVFVVANTGTYFLFSAFVPYMLADLGMYFGGMYPAEYYEGELLDLQGFGTVILVVFLAIAVIILALYLLCWIFSKKNRMGWMIFALILFSIDTAGMLLLSGIQLDGILDIVFHIWVIVSLSMGISACHKLKKLPAEEVEITEAQEINEGDPAQ